jgi:hypothetical protein
MKRESEKERERVYQDKRESARARARESDRERQRERDHNLSLSALSGRILNADDMEVGFCNVTVSQTCVLLTCCQRDELAFVI